MLKNPSQIRILIADDQTDVLEALRFLLKGEGFMTESASSPAGILAALEAKDFDALVMDLNYTRDTTSGGEGLDHRLHELEERVGLQDARAAGGAGDGGEVGPPRRRVGHEPPRGEQALVVEDDVRQVRRPVAAQGGQPAEVHQHNTSQRTDRGAAHEERRARLASCTASTSVLALSTDTSGRIP